ncbi:MAG: hypothetical protein IJD23_10465 [Spirochaetaceae bacterium]|nr:hypothetical protein [Spirochaetaceae bacterium]MBQ3025712.1 hypothetical protein [Spirochaetaceae bacterium]MBQ7906161.1 hypothetical protein [Spirochaetaceae bacterium]
MFEFEEMCKTFEKMSNGERKLYLQEQSVKMINAFETLGSDGIEMFLYFMAVACGADGKLSVEEYSLLQEVTPINLTYSEVEKLVNRLNSVEGKRHAVWISEVVGQFSEEFQDTLISFCLCFCSADKKVSLKERTFIKSLVV